MKNIQVKILDHTAHPLRAIYFGARTCYSADNPQTMWRKRVDRANMQNLVFRTLDAGHHSVLEHAAFVFAVSGISRVCSHQLVRHRLASFSQQSQRYVRASKPTCIVPPTIKRKPALYREYQRTINHLYAVYDKLASAGIPKEDARFVLPNAASTNLIMTMNLRELLHTCSIRLCTNAQWEIRDLFVEIRKMVLRLDAFLGSLLRPKCEVAGYCTESKSCGRFPKRDRGSQDR